MCFPSSVAKLVLFLKEEWAKNAHLYLGKADGDISPVMCSCGYSERCFYKAQSLLRFFDVKMLNTMSNYPTLCFT